jgi:hypothetical protein
MKSKKAFKDLLWKVVPPSFIHPISLIVLVFGFTSNQRRQSASLAVVRQIGYAFAYKYTTFIA